MHVYAQDKDVIKLKYGYSFSVSLAHFLLHVRKEAARNVSDSLGLRWGMLVRIKPWCCACQGDSEGVGSTPYAEQRHKGQKV